MFGITRAPEIDRPGLTWFNTDRPLSLAALRGRIVILDFWTLCCVNCLHVLASLRRIEEAFPAEVAVVGVHSPKFAAEREPQRVEQAILRYGIRHPVVHDPSMSLWRDYAIRAWPTLVFLSPDGLVIGQLPGEPDLEALLEGIGGMVRQFGQEGGLHPQSLPWRAPLPPEGMLRFPAKIKACPSAAGLRLWAVADAGHHQIVLLDDDGREVTRYGAGVAGATDGPAHLACFDHPQGLACEDAALWVADTGNHALRRIDRLSGMVTTVAGQGQRGPVLRGPQRAAAVALASPWDVELTGGQVYIANAGSHQILRYDPAEGMIQVAAGSGGEDIADGPAEHALLAQPSGLAVSADGRSLLFADAETSSIRRLGLDADPQVETLVGQGLFEFGDSDGAFEAALFQHPLALAVGWGGVLVADSYNGTIRRLDPLTRRVETLPMGDCVDPVCLSPGEPAGIAAAGPQRLLLADTNNHRIVEIDLAKGHNRRWAG